MNAAPLQVLLLEDVAMDAELLEFELDRAGLDCEVRRVSARDDFVQALREFHPDVILSDFSLPQFDGMRALELARAWASSIPFIVVTGSINEETAVQCMKAGATDYVLKSNLTRIGPAVRTALERERERGERERAQAALRRSEADLRTIFDTTSQALVLLDREGRVRLFNAAAARAEARLGARIGIGMRIGDLSLLAEDQFHRALTGERASVESAAADGTAQFDITYAPVCDEQHAVIGVCVTAVDITERRRMDDNLRRAERMQATGRLAGGVAHEVNNMMTAILGFGDFLLRSLEPHDERQSDVQEILKAARRAADVTRQLLAFSRQQVLHPRTVDLNAVIRELLPMLQRSVTEEHQLVTHLSPEPCCCHADPGQLEQVLLNLVLNARDAMPEGGRITIQTTRQRFDDSYALRHPDLSLPLGDFVMMAVSDTGAGMDEATMHRIFEPFFTTKPVGQGTGLGLSTAYGIIKQSNGFIFAYSEPGQGTVFKTYLPLSPEPAERPSGPRRMPPKGGSETVLLVEDEPMVRSLAARALRNFGYTIIEASDGRQALEVFQRQESDIALVVTDVAMPDMGGRELATRLNELAPELPVLFMSGYTGEEVTERGMLPAGVPFQSKPFAPDALASRVRHLLDKAAAAGRGRMHAAPTPAAATTIPTDAGVPAGPRRAES
ncbi:MAG TPA: response regulator [Gemmatimonadales bacterium]|jgi:signal transduction histidine kinase|nr:response regulator [Gemmatimonadales bacterium]